MNDQHRIETAADNCEVLRARLAKYEDAEGRPVSALAEQAREIERLRLNIAEYNEHERCYQAEIAALKAQPSGVVQWPDADEIMQMAFEEGQPSEDASGYYFELEEFDLFIQRLMEEVARLNSSLVSACWMMPTAQQLEQALESVPSFHDLSAELIAPAMLEHLRDVISAGEFGDAYRGARDESLIWKRRALEAEAKIREQDQIIENLGNALNGENGPTFMGEPVIRAGGVDERAADALEFADIEGFPEYKVSSDGIIYRKENGNLISQQSNDKGYLTVNLSNACGPVRMTTHRVVLESFVGKRPEGMQARHVDGNPANNRLSNLCWGTAAENEADKAMHGTKAVGSKNGASKLTEEMVREIIAARDSGGRFWGAKAFAEKFGVNLSTIIRVASGRHWAETSAALSAPSHGGGVAHTDCRSEDGITVGLIDSIITSCRVLSSRDLTCEAAVEALRDLRSDSDVSLIKPSHGEQVRDGWQLVPVEPTPEMLAAGDKYIGTPATYKAMLSACPSPAITKDFSQFLSAVMDAAGLIRHGRQSKELSEYLGMKCMEYRGAAALSAPGQGEQVQSCATCNGVGIVGHSMLCPECAAAPSAGSQEQGE